MIKKMLGMAVVVVMTFGVFWLSACNNSHGIPNGKYISVKGSTDTYTLFRDGMVDNDYYWRIKGDKVIWYASNQKSSTYKVIQENGKIYFDDEAKRIEVEYDETTKNLIIIATNLMNNALGRNHGAIFDTRVLSDTKIEVRGTFGRQLSGAVTIPETLNGRSVTTRAASAFANQTQLSKFQSHR